MVEVMELDDAFVRVYCACVLVFPLSLLLVGLSKMRAFRHSHAAAVATYAAENEPVREVAVASRQQIKLKLRPSAPPPPPPAHNAGTQPRMHVPIAASFSRGAGASSMDSDTSRHSGDSGNVSGDNGGGSAAGRAWTAKSPQQQPQQQQQRPK
jgi:uncharacterized membrane protein YgcG